MRHLKNWWRLRQAKHYLKNYWHLIADIILVVIVLELLAALIFIKMIHVPQVNTVWFQHIPKDDNTGIATTSTGSLILKSTVTKKNIYSDQAFSVKLHLENNTSNPISDIQLIPQAGEDFRFTKLESNNASSSLKVNGRKLTLDNLAPGSFEDAEVLVTLNAENDSPRSVSWSLTASYLEANKKYITKYQLDTLKLITDLKLSAIAYYNSPLGDQLGSGPIPPMVGLPTNYWIFFNIDNHGNDLSDLTVAATLPSGVTLSNNKTLSIGELSYNESQKRITWRVKEASAKNETYQAGFEVQLMPTDKQINTQPLLLTSITFLTTDAYTREKLSGRISPLSTDLPDDMINHGQGAVIK